MIVEEKAASTKSEEKERGEEGMSIVDRIKNKVAHFILLNGFDSYFLARSSQRHQRLRDAGR